MKSQIKLAFLLPLILGAFHLHSVAQDSNDLIELPVLDRSWTFNNGAEFPPGGSGRTEMVTTDEKNALVLHYDFGDGGKYVAAESAVEVPEGARELRFKAKTNSPIKMAVRITDATGQVHQTALSYSDAGEWQLFRIELDRKASIHFFGANDGVLHQPIKKIAFVVSQTPEAGSVNFTDIGYLNK